MPLIPSGPVPGMPPQASPAGAPAGADPVEILETMLQLATIYLHVEPDAQDKLAMTQATTQLRRILAKDQADRQRSLIPGPPGLLAGARGISGISGISG